MFAFKWFFVSSSLIQCYMIIKRFNKLLSEITIKTRNWSDMQSRGRMGWFILDWIGEHRIHCQLLKFQSSYQIVATIRSAAITAMNDLQMYPSGLCLVSFEIEDIVKQHASGTITQEIHFLFKVTIIETKVQEGNNSSDFLFPTLYKLHSNSQC